jgi:hypothetical protein
MTPQVLVIDEFLPPELFGLMRQLAHKLEYKDVLAPDGFTYPGVSLDVPSVITEQLAMGLTWWFGRRITNKGTFYRLRLEGQASPHWVHTDAILGQFAFFMHLNPNMGSTVLVHHFETGMEYHPIDEDQVALWEKDKNNYHAWEIDSKLEGAMNRAIIIRADRLHAALPMQGIGDSAANGRLVLTSFFDL